jgi:hypothetical protein
MRAALSILGLVIVLAIILFNAKHQVQSLAPPAQATAGASAPRTLPQAVKAQVQGSMDQAASAAASAVPE